MTQSPPDPEDDIDRLEDRCIYAYQKDKIKEIMEKLEKKNIYCIGCHGFYEGCGYYKKVLV